jgi:hypothetical protein
MSPNHKDLVLLRESASPRDIAGVSTSGPIPVVQRWPDPAAPGFLKSCLAISPEMFAISLMAGALRRAVQAGTISQAESDQILFEFRWRLEADPFPPGFRLFANGGEAN